MVLSFACGLDSRVKAWRRRLSGDGSALVNGPAGIESFTRQEDVAAVAHNAGDTLQAITRALSYGAQIIEMDVVSIGEELYAGHRKSMSRFDRWLFKGPRLIDAWTATGPAAVMLDLKEASARFHDLLFGFLEAHGCDRKVLLVSGNVTTLAMFQRRAPNVLRFYGASPRGRLAAFMQDDELVRMVDGLNLRHDLIDRAVAEWTRAHGLLLIAWTVNDPRRVTDLIELGVDAITTDNLAIIEALTGTLTRRSAETAMTPGM
jgi:hypothetical protein